MHRYFHILTTPGCVSASASLVVMQVIGPPQQVEVVQEQLQPSSTDHLMRRLQQEAAHRFDLEQDAALVGPATLATCPCDLLSLRMIPSTKVICNTLFMKAKRCRCTQCSSTWKAEMRLTCWRSMCCCLW